MIEVTLNVTVQVSHNNDETLLTEAQARSAGVEAISNAIRYAEQNGHEHRLADDVSIGLVAVE